MRSISRHFAVAACALWVAHAAPAAAQEPPAAAPLPAAPQPVAFTVAEGAIVASDAAGQVVWRHALVKAADADKVRGPTRVADAVFYCAHAQLWEAEASSGVVRRRHALQGGCEALAGASDQIVVSVRGSDGPWGWTAEEAFKVGQPVTLRFAEQLQGALLPRAQATRIIEASIPHYNDGPSEAEREASLRAAPDKLEALARALDHAATQDPTNPWLIWRRAEALAARGDVAGAAAARGRLLRLDPAYHHDLILVSLAVDGVDPALAQQLFELGMRRALEQGYEPELANALIHVVIHFGTIGKEGIDAATPAGLARLDRLGERLVDYAPRAEMVAAFYAGLADAHRAQGDVARAEVWATRAADPRAQAFFGVPSSKALSAGGLLTVLMGLLSVFGLMGLIKTARTLGAGFPTPVSPAVRWNPLSRWSRYELIGLLCLMPLTHLLASQVAAGVATVGMLAAAPLSFASGMPGAPSALKYVEGMDSTPGGALVVGLHQHRAGQVEEAEACYLTSATDAAKNNLGVLKAEQGDAASARALWEQAAATIPEAAHNLGRDAESPRVARAKRYGVTRPLLALPTQAHWDGFWDAKVAASQAHGGDPVTALFSLAQLTSALDDSASAAPSGGAALGWLGWLLTLLAVVALATAWGAPQPQHKRWHLGGWAAGHLVPGMARQWGVIGPFVTGLLVTALLAKASMDAGGTPSILDNIAIPNFSNYYGVSGQITRAELSALVALGRWWWALWLLGVAVSVGLEIAMPDPARRRE